MEFTVSRSAFHRAMSILAGIASRSSTMEILKNALIQCDGKSKLRLAASDLSSTLVLEIECEGKQEGGVTLDAKRITEIAKSAAGDSIRLKVDEQHRAEMKAGRSKFELSGLSRKDYPELPKGAGAFAEIDRAAFLDVLAAALPACSPEETKYHLCGLHLECDGKRLLAAGADGGRMHIAERPSKLATFSAFLPRKGVGDLMRLIEETDKAEIAITPDAVMVRTPGALLSVKLLQSQFPKDALTWVRKENDQSAIAPRQALIEALNRVAVLASTETGTQGGSVALVFSDKTLKVSGEQSGVGASEDFVDVSYTGKGFAAQYNAKMLAEALSLCPGDESRLGMAADEKHPMQVEPVDGGGFAALVMPRKW